MMSSFLLIDDDEDFKDSFKMDAQPYGFSMFYGRSLEALKEKMPKYHHRIFAVVLDIKCLQTENQKKEDATFIGLALRYLDQKFPDFPRIILTGDKKSFEEYPQYRAGEDFFLKDPKGRADALAHLKHSSENCLTLNIRKEHSQVFDLFDKGYFDLKSEQTLMNVLKKLDERDDSKFGGIFRDIRSLQETIYKTINVKKRAVVPNNNFEANGMIKFGQLMKHLNGNPDRYFNTTTTIYQTPSISNQAKTLYWVCGENVHAQLNAQYRVTNYSIRSMTYSLLELFIWSEQFLK